MLPTPPKFCCGFVRSRTHGRRSTHSDSGNPAKMITKIVLDVSFENSRNQPCSKMRTFRATSLEECLSRVRTWFAQNQEELGVQKQRREYAIAQVKRARLLEKAR